VVYDLGDGRVLRRYRNPAQSAEREAAIMLRAGLAGVPVPTVHAVDGADIVMDRIDGPTMLAALLDDPGRARDSGVLLAQLHRGLDATAVDGPESAVVHGDLHPGNVLMGPAGPVIIDWTNSRTGPRSLDVALSWIVLACFRPDEATDRTVERVRVALLSGFLDSVDVGAATASLVAAAAIRHGDPATTTAEHACIDRLVVDARSTG
jgi:aminoglycoside phosphotransferase (APT) family kinase protein